MRVEGWTPAKLGDFAWEPTERPPANAEVLSVTKHRGFVPSLEYFGKQVFSKDTDSYKLVRRGQFAYATIHLDEGSIDYLKDRDHGTISPMYTVFDVDDRRVDRRFLLELLRTPAMLDRYAAIGQGSINRRKSIAFEALANETLLLPPLLEQKKIATILSSVDEAIQATQLVIDQTRRVRDGLLQHLLTRGLPGHTRFRQTEIGEIPESWEIRRCEDLAHQISVGIVVKPTQYYVETGVKCWRSANVGEGFVRDSDWVHISDETNRMLSKTRLDTGDVVVVRTGYPGTACVVPPELDQTNCVDLLFVRPRRDEILPTFLCYFINSECGKGQVLKGQGGLAQKHFNVGELNKMWLVVPPTQEQAVIVSRLDEVQRSIAASESQLAMLRTTKAGLLQDLLTGKVRVSP